MGRISCTVWLVARAESRQGLSRQGPDKSIPPIPSRDPISLSFGRTLRAHLLSFLFPTHHPSIRLGRDGHQTREPFPRVSVSRYPSPGRSRAPGDSHPTRLPSQSVITRFPVLTMKLHNIHITLLSVRAKVVWPVRAK
jgi:hypothetical protein